MKNTLTIGIFGLGSIGQRHARNAVALGHKVIGYEPDQARHKALSESLDITLLSREDVVAKADFVLVATPSQFHLEDVSDLVAKSIPVLTEKPLGHDYAQAAELVARAEAAGVTIGVSHNLRFRDSVRRVKDLLQQEMIGRAVWSRFTFGAYLPDWRPGQDYRQNYAASLEGGGVILDVIHELDLSVHLLGEGVCRSSMAESTGLLEIPTEDIAEITVAHETGAFSSIHLDYVSRPRRREFTIQGSEGALSANLVKGSVEVWDIQGESLLREELGFDPNKEYLAVLQDFSEALLQGRKPLCQGRDALVSLAIASDARRSFSSR